MTEPEWKDANPSTADLPNKGRSAIIFIVCGIALFVLSRLGIVIRPLGLAAGIFGFMAGIAMIIRSRKGKGDFKTGLIVTAAGFLMLLANPRMGTITAGIAGTILMIGAVGLVVIGIGKAVKLSWDLGKRS